MSDNMPVAREAGDVARPVGDVATLHHFLDSMAGELEKALRAKIDPAYFTRIAVSCFAKNPKLLQCTKASIAASLLQAAELGLLLHSELGHAYLVPYYNKNTRASECQMQMGYRGLITLCRRSGNILNARADIVYEKDEFTYEKGTRPFLKHRPATGDRGKAIGVYAILDLPNGAPPDFDFWDVARINEHKRRFVKARRSGGIDMWTDAWEWAWKKTVLRGICKLQADSPELSRAAAIDEYNEAGVQSAPALGATMRQSWASQLNTPKTVAKEPTNEQDQADPPMASTADEGAPDKSGGGAPSDVREEPDEGMPADDGDPWDRLGEGG